MGNDLPLKGPGESTIPANAPGDAAGDGPRVFSISQYNQSVERKVKAFPKVWVKGVIMQLNQRGRIAYITLGEFAEGDARPRAVLEATMWTSELEVVNLRFARLPTPLSLRVDLKVAFLLEPNFYVPSGRFQPRVVDIDEKFTLGELTLTRQKIIESLAKEGLLKRNKSLALPERPLRVGLITAPGSAAYQDFTTVLVGSGFSFRILFAGARMQGEATESTVVKALAALVKARPDVICIVRGGGSKTDLVYFDAESICRAIAQCPVPVLTGIGHEIDNSLADLVAHMNLITPTDCAKFLETRLAEQYGRLAEIASEVGEAWRMACQDAWHGLSQTAGVVTRAWEGRRAAEDLRGRGQARELASQARRLLAEGQRRLAADRTGLARGPRKTLRMERLRFANRTQGLAHAWERLRKDNSYLLRSRSQALFTGTKALLAEARRRIAVDRVGLARGPVKLVLLARETLALKERLAQAADPARLLALGFSLLRTREGRLVRGIADVAAGDIIINTLADGSVESQVTVKKGQS